MPTDSKLHKACNSGSLDEVKELVQTIDVNKAGAAERTPLHRAVGKNYSEIAEFLISKGADVNKADKSGRVPLHWACIGGHVECCKILLSNNVNVNAQTKSGMSPFHGAAEGGCIEVVKELLDYHLKKTGAGAEGVNWTLEDGDGKTGFQLAKQNNHKAILNLFKGQKIPGVSKSDVCTVM